ncbi:glycosyltransferase family A protein [Bacillus sp. ISL-57]|uniref:glycosyltransferase family 2 protein n=1 Tax=Bacillus sp. ISL-57 TaxID=2819135 RepID=UPI001BECF264|nr:glycosyltransferase family A protein [Bacillus sp. ISL-57]MBT2718165.1 glycosyltransferase family 2 protein [Bacillus sp. ISL-57]
MKDPLVSIIIPVYNVEDYLERCLNSIVNQTYQNLEVLVINDGSTDSSSEILTKFQEIDCRFNVITKENGGQASARNVGIDKANGEFILMVDSDDYISNNAVELCVNQALISGCDLIIFDFYYLNSKGQTNYINTGIRLDDANTGPCNKFYHKSLWSNHKFPEGYWYEDLGIIPAILANADKIVKIDKPLYYYDKSRGESQTNQINHEKFHDIIPMLKNVSKEIKSKEKLIERQPEIEYLFIAHLLYITVLLRLPNIKDNKIKRNFVDIINKEIEQSVPNWDTSDFKGGSFFTNIYKKIVIKSYLKKNFLFGDLFWKFPKKLKSFISGF